MIIYCISNACWCVYRLCTHCGFVLDRYNYAVWNLFYLNCFILSLNVFRKWYRLIEVII